MNIRNLKYLIAIADFNHFGKAADVCCVSQPALSMQIKKLEETLGVILIERTNKKIFFTETGKLIVQQARNVLNSVGALQDIANQAKDPFSGELHVGVIPTLAPYLLPLVVPNVTTLFPKLTLYLVEETTANLRLKLDEGKIDAVLLASPEEGDISITPLLDEEFVLAVPCNHPLAKQSFIKLTDLSNKAVLLLEEGHCMREQALAICQNLHAFETKRFCATSLETLRYMVAAGAGITLMPRLACRINDGVCYIPFTKPVPKRTINLIWRKSSVKKLILEHLALHIKTVMKSS